MEHRGSLQDTSSGGRFGSSGRPLFTSVSPSENATSTSHSEEAQSAQARKLQLRKARFRGLVVPTRSSPSAGARRSSIEVASPELTRPSPFENGSLGRRQSRTFSNDLGILHEISSSSLKRKTSQRQDIRTLFQPESYRQTSGQTPTLHLPEDDPELLPFTNSAHLLQIPRNEVANTPKRREPRASSKDNLNNDTVKYIEHLESQLAALQTQIQSLSLPSTSKTQSAKLRAMNSESRLLKQEIADWESKFHERIKEQLEQHEVVVGKLKAEIRHLEKQVEADTDQIKELQVQSNDKTRQLVVVESANYDLERRLEFMSELLATSTSRIDLHSDNQLTSSRRGGRPKSVGPLRIPTPVLRQFSPQRDPRQRRSYDPTRTPELDSPVQSGAEENPFERLRASTRSIETSPELASVVSENTLVESLSMSPGSRRSMIFSQSVNSEQESRNRPVRRMRRFYTGSTGPRSLILPATTHGSSFPPSAPIPESPNPSIHHHHMAREGLGFKLPISPERPRMHKRSATWDEGESMSVRARRIAAISPIAETQSPLPLRQPLSLSQDGNRTPPTPFFPPPQPTSQEDTPSFSDDSAQLMANRAISLSSVRGRNLFDELNRMKLDDDNEDTNTAHHTSSSPFRNFSGPASFNATPLATSAPELEHSPHTSPTPAQLAGPFKAANMAAKRSAASLSASSSSSQKQSSPSPTPGLVERLLSLISRRLDASLPSVKTVVSSAWSILSLSRPVLEFRFWLIRLLLGDLKKKHMHLLALRDAAQRPNRVMDNMVAVPPGSSAGTVGLGLSHADSIGRSGSIRRRAKLLDAFNENDVELSTLRNRRRRDKKASSDAASDESDDMMNSVELVEQSDTRYDIAKARDTSTPVNWLKFSMTLVFAVGVAIKDGPATLFTPPRSPTCTCSGHDD